MIKTFTVTQYRPVCDHCGWTGSSVRRAEYAERELRGHKCGEHRPEFDSTGGHRGILGGYNRYCVCGAHWVTEFYDTPFKCPKDVNA